MGVKDLWSILAPVKKHHPITSLKGQTIAVDLSVWVCESVTVKHMQGRVVKPHLRNLFFRVSNLLQLGIKLVFVIDGEAPELKWEEMARRTQARYGAFNGGKAPRQKQTKKGGGRSNFKVWLRECQEMLSYLGVPCVQAKGEAEAMCALLNSQGIVDACLTEDGDAFLYGAHTVYKNFTLNTKDPHVDCYSMTDIEQDLGLDRDKLVALGLLLGCDYLPKGVVGVGKEQGCQLMRQLNNVKVLQRFEHWADGRLSANSSQVAKPSHCRVCYHIGTGKQHKMRGCGMCGTQIACMEQPRDTECYCAWHKAQSVMDGTALERDIMRKALRTEGFPFKPVISEFLDRHDTCPSSPLCWSRPQLAPLQKFNLIKLEWPEDYTMEKVFPLITLWDLSSIINGTLSRKMESLVLESFVKTRTRQGVPCIEVQWVRPDWNGIDDDSKFYNTIERDDLLASAYPVKYKAFMDEKETRRSKASSKGKGKKKSKADMDTDEAISGSQQLPAASSSAVDDDGSLDSLITSVTSLQISNTSMTAYKGTNQEKDLKRSEEDIPSLEGLKEEKVQHPVKYITSQTKTSGRSKASHKGRRIAKAKDVSSEEDDSLKTPASSVRKDTKPTKRNKKKVADCGDKTANSSDLNLLEELLEYEATQSCLRPEISRSSQQCVASMKPKVAGSMDDVSMLHNKHRELPEGTGKLNDVNKGTDKEEDKENDIDNEILPLFQRIRLKSVKGTARKAKPSISDAQPTEHIACVRTSKQDKTRTDNIGERNNEQVKEVIFHERLKKSFPKCNGVIVIDSDSDKDSVKQERVDVAFPSRTESWISVNPVDSHDNNSYQGKKSDDASSVIKQSRISSSSRVAETELSSRRSRVTLEKIPDKDVTAESSDLTASTEHHLTDKVADKTAVADYRLIHTDVTMSSQNTLNPGVGNFTVGTLSHVTPEGALTESSVSCSPIINSDIPEATSHSVKTNQKDKTKLIFPNPTSCAEVPTVLSTNSDTPKATHLAVTSPSFSASADITASSTNSYWCEDSQMSLFDSPSFAEVSKANASWSASACKSRTTDSSFTGDNPTVTDSVVVPQVIDLDTPDIPEELSSEIGGKEECRKTDLASSSEDSSMSASCDIHKVVDKLRGIPESLNEFTSNDTVSAKVIDLDTPDIPDEISEANTSSNVNSQRHVLDSSRVKSLDDFTSIDISPNEVVLDTPDIPDEICKENSPSESNRNHVSQSTLTNSASMSGSSHAAGAECTQANPSPTANLDHETECHSVNECNSRLTNNLFNANITCVPVALNCDTPVISDTVSSNQRTANETKLAQVNPTDQKTPHIKRHQLKPQTLRLDMLQSPCAPIVDAGVLESVDRYNQSYDNGRCYDMAGVNVDCEDSSPVVSPYRQKVTRVKSAPEPDGNFENSPVCLLDRLRKKFDRCGDKKATLNAMTLRSKPR